MLTSIVSSFTQRKVKANLAMTGEITLTGRVLPIGGLREKSMAAYRAGIRKIIIPYKNLPDLEKIPEAIRKEINFVPTREISEVIKAVQGIEKCCFLSEFRTVLLNPIQTEAVILDRHLLVVEAIDCNGILIIQIVFDD